MWFLMALSSAILLGFYDVQKKQSLRDNAVIPVLFLNTLFSTMIMLPILIGSRIGSIDSVSHYYVPVGTLWQHLHIVLKAVIVLSSWVCGYFAIKHLPLTIVGPVNASRPVLTLLGACILFGERLNVWQWSGVVVAIVAFLLLSRSGKREGIDFASNRWIALLVAAAVFGAVSGLYDKHLLAPVSDGGLALPASFVQVWFNVYQMFMMAVVLFVWWRAARRSAAAGVSQHRDFRFEWRWSIPLISLFLCAADMCYFYSLSLSGALIAVVSMTRRSSVLVSFLFGAFVLRERSIGSKAFDLLLVLLSMLLLTIGTLGV